MVSRMAENAPKTMLTHRQEPANVQAPPAAAAHASMHMSATLSAIGANRLPLVVTFNGHRVEVTATLDSAEGVDQLIRVLQANKPLLPAKSTPADAAAENDAEGAEA